MHLPLLLWKILVLHSGGAIRERRKCLTKNKVIIIFCVAFRLKREMQICDHDLMMFQLHS
jgi:hypothetical protein